MLNKILKEKKPEFLGACFDVSRQTKRSQKFAEYKIQRPPMPEDLSSQIPLIKKVISAYGIAIFEKEGYEADDIIATLAQKAKRKNMAVTFVSSDKDTLQLVGGDITVFSPYKEEGTIYDEKKVLERFGVKPSQITEVIALMGDSADNIPSVPGIGEKTAVELIQNFGSLEKLLRNLDKIKSEKLKQAIKGNLEKIKLNQELAVLDRDIEVDFDLDKLKVGQPDYQELFRLFKHLEFKAFLKDLPVKNEQAAKKAALSLKDKELKDFIKEQDELILYGNKLDNLSFCLKDKIFCVPKPSANLEAVLANPKIKKISHDLKKIKVSLAKENIILEGLYFDTMIAAYLINPSKPGYALTELAWEYLAMAFKPDSLDNAQAVEIIGRLVPRLEKELKDKALGSLFSEIEMPLAEVLSQMELTGIKLDVKILKALSRNLEKRLIALIEEIYSSSECQFNLNSPKQLREVLFEKLKLPVIKKTKTGPSTDEEVLRKLADKHQLPALLLEYRQLTKLKSTYIDALPGLIDPRTGRIHTSFNQTATETGRLSSSNHNLQFIPF